MKPTCQNKMIRFIESAQTFPIRKRVLRNHLENPVLDFEGDNEKTTFHLGYFSENELVGIVSILKRDFENLDTKTDGALQLRGMAINPENQNQKIGKALLNESEFQAQQRGYELIWCNARERALLFYQKNGYQIIEDAFEIPMIGSHYKMYKVLQ